MNAVVAAPQWVPDGHDIERARITDFARFVGGRHGVAVPDYQALWQWSVDDLSGFWGSVWDYFELGDRPGEVLSSSEMPGAQWFPEVRLNYVDQVIRQARSDRPAIVSVDESGSVSEMAWDDMLNQVAALAQTLRELGVRQGDRVVGYLPNVAEAVIAFLATVSVGAVWSACGQDYSAKAALDRLGQLEPVVLVASAGYVYGGKEHRRFDEIAELRAGLPTLVATVLVSDEAVRGTLNWAEVTADGDRSTISTAQVSFDHPLWVLYSSGTTGLPKGIVHGHGGVLVEHLKALGLQSDIGPDDTFLWYTSPSWMMWNFQVAGLLLGATIVCYAGSPSYPTPDALWDIASRVGVTVLGTSPGYVLACAKAGAVPHQDHDLSALRLIGVTGSALPPSSSIWLRDNVGAHIPVAAISGGTDVVSAFAGGARTIPVWPGELSAPYLGVSLEAWDEQGAQVHCEVGELVITEPMPSMPVAFWNDLDGARYRAAYFDTYPGAWRHGDWITRTAHGSIIVHGRSDSTLNRHGIRMGSADIYQAVEQLPEITDALVIGAEQPDGAYWMPLFVVLADGSTLTDDLTARIRTTIRTRTSPRHVPDDIIQAPAIPRTRTGKKLEVPIKKLLQGADPTTIVDPSAVDNPDLFTWYAQFAR